MRPNVPDVSPRKRPDAQAEPPISIPVTAEVKRRIRFLAHRTGLSLGEWARRVVSAVAHNEPIPSALCTTAPTQNVPVRRVRGPGVRKADPTAPPTTAQPKIALAEAGSPETAHVDLPPIPRVRAWAKAKTSSK